MLVNANALIESCRGQLSKLYHARVLLDQSCSAGHLKNIKDPDRIKLLIKIEKRFPKPVDFNKIGGHEEFFADCPSIISELAPCYDAIKESVHMIEGLTKLMAELHLAVLCPESPREFLWTYINLFRSFMQIHYMLDSIAEKSLCVMLYYTAKRVVERDFDKLHLAEMSAVLELIEANNNLCRHLISQFVRHHTIFLHIFSCIEEVVQFTHDQSWIEPVFSLHNGEPGNIEAIEDLPHFMVTSSKPANRSTPSSFCMLAELQHLTAYHEFIVLASLASPQLLYQPSVQAMLSLVLSKRTLLVVFRDVTVNLHLELEELAAQYPTPADEVVIPRGMKLKSYLRSLCKLSYQHVSQSGFVRRAELITKLRTYLALWTAYPGLCAPKLCHVILLGQLLRDELVLHMAQYSPHPLRTDCAKYYALPCNSMAVNNVAEGLDVLYKCIGELERRRTELQKYFAEVVDNMAQELQAMPSSRLQAVDEERQAFGAALTSCAGDTASPSPSSPSPSSSSLLVKPEPLTKISQQYAQLVSALLSAIIQPASSAAASSSTSAAAATAVAAIASSRSSLPGGLPILSATSSIYVSSTSSAIPAVDSGTLAHLHELTLRVRATTRYASYAFGLDYVLHSMMNPQAMGWFRKAVLEMVTRYVHPSTPSGSSSALSTQARRHQQAGWASIFRFVQLYTYILHNLHADCKQEACMLGENTVLFVDMIFRAIGNQFLHSFQEVWDYLSMFTNQTSFAEATKKLERVLMGMQQDGGASTAAVPQPGVESEYYNQVSIDKFVHVSQALSQLIEHAHSLSSPASSSSSSPSYLQVFTRKYYPLSFLLNKVTTYLRQALLGLFAVQNHKIYKFSLAIKRFRLAFQALDWIVKDHSHVSFQSFREQIFNELVWNSFEGVGVIGTPLNPSLPLSEQTIISPIVSIFLHLLDQIAEADSGLVYLPYRQVFVNRYLASTFDLEEPPNAGSKLPVEKFINPQELLALMGFVGIPGWRILEAKLLNVVLEEMEDLVAALIAESSYLKLLKHQCVLTVAAALSMKNLPQIKRSLKRMGVALIFREMLKKALYEHNASELNDQVFCRETTRCVETFHRAINPWACEIPSDHFLYYTLLNNLGIADERDIALTQYILSVEWTEEDIASLQLLPIATAALFAHEDFTAAEYDIHSNTFANNEHVVMFALSKLLVASVNLQDVYQLSPAGEGVEQASVSQLETLSEKSHALRSAPHVDAASLTSATTPSRWLRCRACMMSFLDYAGKVLLVLKSQELAISSHPPYSGMFMLLVYFATLCRPWMDGRDGSNEGVTFGYLHQLQRDLALGRVRLLDTYRYSSGASVHFRAEGESGLAERPTEGNPREDDDGNL